jgi:hypothetical protein
MHHFGASPGRKYFLKYVAFFVGGGIITTSNGFRGNKMKTEYYEMLEKAKAGIITIAEWQDYCNEVLRKVLEENISIFERLKDK